MGLAVASAGCAARGPVATVPVDLGPYEVGWTQTGVSSWYGEPFHGRRTASGEVYDMETMTAAHQSLPFGTVILVENRDNDRRAELTVNDRGPFAKNRILDVSRAGARALGMLGPGTARVRVTILKAGGDIVSVRGGCVDVQIGSFRDRPSADARRTEARRDGIETRIERSDGWYRVLAGPFHDEAGAQRAIDAFDGFARRCAM